MTRSEAVTMLVRLLGRENEALSGKWETPFTDVPAWAEPYVGLAYENGLTTGTGGHHLQQRRARDLGAVPHVHPARARL